MSSSLINHNPDLAALVRDGYRVTRSNGYLLVRGIPYVNAAGTIATGNVVAALQLVGEQTQRPSDHTVWWSGQMPHRATGESMESYLVCQKWDGGHHLGNDITVYAQWSRKPRVKGGSRTYQDYYDKITAYVNEVAGEAELVSPGVLDVARGGYEPGEVSASRFKYLDTNTYRAGTRGIEECIEDEIVAVVGVGGSGSYLVDILAKTNVRELHLFDRDVLWQHNAFRLAGAARLEELGGGKSKVKWHNERYAPVREEGVHIHEMRIDEDTSDYLAQCTMVFIAVEPLTMRRRIQRLCNEMAIPHIAVGIGVEIEGEANDSLGGMVKIERQYIAHEGRDSHWEDDRADGHLPEVYGNIQTAELNMLSAALAIVEWKAMRGFYRNDRDASDDTILYVVSGGDIRMTRKGRAQQG